MKAAQTLGIDGKAAAMLLALGAVWGGSFFFAEVALDELPPLTITLHRVAWAVPILGVILWAKGLALPRSVTVWGAYMIMGALNNAIPFALIFWGQTQIDSGLASILNAMTAPFAALAAGLLLADERLTLNCVLGAVIGLAGVAIIMGPSAALDFNLGNLAQVAILGAGVSYALAGVWGRKMLSGQVPLVNAFGMLSCSVALLLPVVFWVDGPPRWDLSLTTWSALIGLASLSTALGYVLYFGILARAGAANLLLVTFLVPPFSIGLGVLVLGERLEPTAWAGLVVILSGLAVTDGRMVHKIRSRRRGAAS